MQPGPKDIHIDELLPQMSELIDKGANVFVKWTCPRCGERVTASEPNKLYINGYVHTATESGEECGGFYEGPYYGMLVITGVGKGGESDEVVK